VEKQQFERRKRPEWFATCQCASLGVVVKQYP